MKPPARHSLRGWAVVLTDGRVVVEVGFDVSEAQAWQIALGWPSTHEIEWHKARGAHAFRCLVVRDCEP